MFDETCRHNKRCRCIQQESGSVWLGMMGLAAHELWTKASTNPMTFGCEISFRTRTSRRALGSAPWSEPWRYGYTKRDCRGRLMYRVRPKRQSISSWLRWLLSQSNNPGTCSTLEAKRSCLCADAQGTDRFDYSHFSKTTPTDALLPRVFVHPGLRRRTEDPKQKREGKKQKKFQSRGGKRLFRGNSRSGIKQWDFWVIADFQKAR
jgi:hypothetical protein